MLTEKDYCDYETCVALKELGFSSVNNECFQSKIVSKEIPLKFFDTTLQGTSLEYAPIISLYEAQKWLREEKGIHITINYIRLEEDIFMYTLRHIGKKLREGGVLYNNQQYSSYEEALFEGIKEAVKILIEENNGNSL